jgi:aryl-alcohol dehydrogenase-like predicted oxidoreductase
VRAIGASNSTPAGLRQALEASATKKLPRYEVEQPRGLRILKALDEVSAARGAKPAEVALAWLIAQEGVTAPIASATSVEQVDSLARAAALELSAQELQALTMASDS